ncbi:hypothetical protein HII36_22330 [Nonomuraea sp. NN258]|uniref:hypothetical protein n=1 Tax=Nonomuraea antri TaxID=2730852 RepID=UPI0015689152|nr:hypothetical protein [Nonomuraea antri]NRQ34557.1 hypothetical protein [Nonomuraea antri]
MADSNRLMSLDGRLARAVNVTTSSVSYILIKAGTLTYGDGSRNSYIQIFQAIPDHAGSWRVWDVLDDEAVDEIVAELEQGSYEWYGEQLELAWLEGDEEISIRRQIGWLDMT